jgi:hypothetical protein
MPDAVTSRKRQVSRLRFYGSKGASNKPLYKAPDIRRRRRRESGSCWRNFHIVFVEVSLAGNSRVVFSAMMVFRSTMGLFGGTWRVHFKLGK